MDEPAVRAADEDEVSTEDSDSEDEDLASTDSAEDQELEVLLRRNQETPLHAACQRGDLATIRMLLDAGAHVNSRNRFRFTPLHCACHGGDLEVVQELIRRGADIFQGTTIAKVTPPLIVHPTTLSKNVCCGTFVKSSLSERVVAPFSRFSNSAPSTTAPGYFYRLGIFGWLELFSF